MAKINPSARWSKDRGLLRINTESDVFFPRPKRQGLNVDERINIKARAVIFDMDGVITNTMPFHFDAWKQVLSKRGIDASCYDIYEREGQSGSDTIREIFAEYGLKASPEEQRKILRQKESLFKKSVKTRFIKGSREFLKILKSKGFLLALVTGTSRKEVRQLLHTRIYNMFDVIITGDEVVKGKPNPEPFLKALRKLKVPRTEAVVIENAPFGIAAARKAGLFCIALQTSLPQKFLKEANLIFKSMPELKNGVRIIF